MLRGVRGIFPYNGMPDRDVFSTYISSLQLDANFTGVLSIGIVELVPEDHIDGIAMDHLEIHADWDGKAEASEG